MCYFRPPRSRYPRANPNRSCSSYCHIRRRCTSGTSKSLEGFRFDLEAPKSWCDCGSCSRDCKGTHTLRRARDQGRFQALLRPMRRAGYRRVIFLQICMRMWHRQHSTCHHHTKDLLRRKNCSDVSILGFCVMSRSHSPGGPTRATRTATATSTTAAPRFGSSR